MKEIVVISGKGGTGKTSITASFAFIGGDDMVLADCDVDASDMHLLLAPVTRHREDFSSSQRAVIDGDTCIKCGKCEVICNFDAIYEDNGNYSVRDMDCEGCGYCTHICPRKAIKLEYRLDGEFFISDTRLHKKLFHAALGPGSENSGKLVTKVKSEAKKFAMKNSAGTVLVDGSPGVGCPVIASLSGASYVITVTEPTVSGIHDLKRVVELVSKFRIPSGTVINKSDLNPSVTNDIRKYLWEHNIPLLAEIPYTPKFTEAMVAGKTAAEYDPELRSLLEKAWNSAVEQINQKENK